MLSYKRACKWKTKTLIRIYGRHFVHTYRGALEPNGSNTIVYGIRQNFHNAVTLHYSIEKHCNAFHPFLADGKVWLGWKQEFLHGFHVHRHAFQILMTLNTVLYRFFFRFSLTQSLTPYIFTLLVGSSSVFHWKRFTC